MQFIVEHINPLNIWNFLHLAVMKFPMKCIGRSDCGQCSNRKMRLKVGERIMKMHSVELIHTLPSQYKY